MLLGLMGGLLIIGMLVAYLGSDVPNLYRKGKNVREGSYHHSHYRSGGFHHYGGGGTSPGK